MGDRGRRETPRLHVVGTVEFLTAPKPAEEPAPVKPGATAGRRSRRSCPGARICWPGAGPRDLKTRGHLAALAPLRSVQYWNPPSAERRRPIAHARAVDTNLLSADAAPSPDGRPGAPHGRMCSQPEARLETDPPGSFRAVVEPLRRLHRLPAIVAPRNPRPSNAAPPNPPNSPTPALWRNPSPVVRIRASPTRLPDSKSHLSLVLARRGAARQRMPNQPRACRMPLWRFVAAGRSI